MKCGHGSWDITGPCQNSIREKKASIMNANISSSQKDREPRPPCVAEPAHELSIGGITPFTTIDFPGRLAAVFYTQGCAWRCRYCHNPHLWPFRSDAIIPFHKALRFLENRKGFLDGVVFSGGEPTAHEGLPSAIQTVKTMGFQAALHTAGMYPDRLREVLCVCDWVGMDVKAPFHSYQKITQTGESGIHPSKSVDVVLESGIEYEFRTTVHPALLSEAEVLEIAGELRDRGAKHFALQAFQPKGCSDETLKNAAVSPEWISSDLRNELTSMFKSFQIRKFYDRFPLL